MHSLRRAHDDGRPAHGATLRRLDQAPEGTIASDQRGRNARYAFGKEAGGSGGVSARGKGAVFRHVPRDGEIGPSDRSGISDLTSVVVTHDMRLAKKLADRVVFLHEAKVLFFGTYPEMEKSDHPIVQEFLKLDELDLGA